MFSFQVALWINLRSDATKEKQAELCRWRWDNFSTQMLTHASAAEPLNLFQTHTHTQSWACAFEGPAGPGSGYKQEVLALWEIWDASLPSTFSRIHIINFLAFPSFFKQIPRWNNILLRSESRKRNIRLGCLKSAGTVKIYLALKCAKIWFFQFQLSVSKQNDSGRAERWYEAERRVRGGKTKGLKMLDVKRIASGALTSENSL